MQSHFLQIFREARRVAPSVIYIPHVDSLWSTTTDTLKATFLSLVNDLPPNLPLLLFATCDSPISKIPHDLSMLFSLSCEQVRLLGCSWAVLPLFDSSNVQHAFSLCHCMCLYFPEMFFSAEEKTNLTLVFVRVSSCLCIVSVVFTLSDTWTRFL